MFDKKDSLHFCKLYQFNSRILDFVFLIFYIVSQQLRSNQLVVISSSISTLLCSFTWFWQNRPWERSLISIIYSTLVCLSCVQIALFIDNKRNIYNNELKYRYKKLSYCHIKKMVIEVLRKYDCLRKFKYNMLVYNI